MSRKIRIGRRAAMAALGATLVAPAWALSQASEPRIGLGFSLYGMKSLSVEKSLEICRAIGYDCVELPVMADWPTNSRLWTDGETTSVRDALEENGLRLSALMENLRLNSDDAVHRENIIRLESAARLGHDLSPSGPCVIETVLGGRPERWADERQAMARRLKDWAVIAEQSRAVIAIKAHVGGALHRPEDAVWLMEQAASERIRLVFDYSHFQLRGISLEAASRAMLPFSAFVHVKDAEGTAEKFRFLLPGAGNTDYVALFGQLKLASYTGDVLVEVSGQIHSRPEYDPIAAARQCYSPLAEAMKRAGITRKQKG